MLSYYIFSVYLLSIQMHEQVEICHLAHFDDLVKALCEDEGRVSLMKR
jgi:hypothetical protein